MKVKKYKGAVKEKKVPNYMVYTCSAGQYWDKALSDMAKNSYEPLFMPEIIDLRLSETHNDGLIDIYNTTLNSVSVAVQGRYKNSDLIVVAHLPTSLLDPVLARDFIDNAEQGISKKEFKKLVDAKDNKNVFVIDYKKARAGIRNYLDNISSLKNFMKCPLTIPFFGSEERAERYFKLVKECSKKLNTDLEITFDFTDNFGDDNQVRFLSVGDITNENMIFSLDEPVVRADNFVVRGYGPMKRRRVEPKEVDVRLEGRVVVTEFYDESIPASCKPVVRKKQKKHPTEPTEEIISCEKKERPELEIIGSKNNPAQHDEDNVTLEDMLGIKGQLTDMGKLYKRK